MTKTSAGPTRLPCVMVMGVSGSGKTTVGRLLASRLRVDFADGDDFHSPSNLAKMAAGTGLTDEDRWPWLEAVARWLGQRRDTGAVITCSALKRRYRDVVRAQAPDLWLLHLAGSRELIGRRVAERQQHFMPVSLVAAQFDDLEPPTAGERAVTADVTWPPDEIAVFFLDRFRTPTPRGDS